MTKIKRCYKGKPLDNINLKSGDSYHEGVENISNILAGDDLPDDIYLNFEDDEDCRPQKEALGCDDCRKDPDYVYCGKDLPTIGINNGDSYEEIFEAINNTIKECADSTVLVKYENGDEIEFVTLSGGEHKEVIVPNCIPSEVQIYNSEGTLLQTITLEQGQSIKYTTPDSTAEVRYDDGTLITTVNIPSGETQTIYIPNCEPTITYIVDEASNPLGEVVLESGTQDTFVCPNGMVNVENSLGEVIGTGSVLSGGSGLVTVGDTNLVVEYADGTPITTESIPSSSAGITITVPNCEDVEVTLENTTGLELDNETYASGTTNTIIAPDATYALKDSAGITISTDVIPSGQSENVTAPDATYTLTNTVPTTIGSGNIVSNGSATIIAPDANYKITNSNGTELSSGSIPSDTLGTLLAPDAIVEVKDQDGNLLDNGNAPSSTTTTFTVNIPTPPLNYTAQLLRTMQPTSYETGDDGDTSRGQDFFKLPQDNIFGHIWRLTGVTGGYYDADTLQYKDVDGTVIGTDVPSRLLAFPDGIMIDHGTRQNGLTLGYDLNALRFLGYNNMDWETSVAFGSTLTTGGYTDWTIMNKNEMMRLDWNDAGLFAPIGLFNNVGAGSIFFRCGTTVKGLPAFSYAYDSGFGQCSYLIKTSSQDNINDMYVRYFTDVELL